MSCGVFGGFWVCVVLFVVLGCFFLTDKYVTTKGFNDRVWHFFCVYVCMVMLLQFRAFSANLPIFTKDQVCRLSWII